MPPTGVVRDTSLLGIDYVCARTTVTGQVKHRRVLRCTIERLNDGANNNIVELHT